LAPENWQEAGFGLYIHWPFCQSKCPYCDFNSHVSTTIDQKDWEKSYLKEIDRVAAETKGRVLSSIFFGGGTPSLMDPRLVDSILNKISAQWSYANDVEITLEANPSSVEAAKFASFAQSGVNRVSLGIQALNEPDLKRLGRLHTVDEATDALGVASKLFPRWSFDLIYARQSQTLTEWEAELKRALMFGAEHMSLYQLTIEPQTAFGARWREGKLKGLPEESLSADMYHLTQQIMSDAKLRSYEVSNHSAVGQESRHNMIYWKCGDYLGIGPGAHGRLTLNDQRYATQTFLQPTRWLTEVLENGSGESSRENLSSEDNATEYVLMSLRTNEGLDLDRAERLGVSIKDNKIKYLRDLEMISIQRDTISVPAEKRVLLNSVIEQLLT